MNNPKRVLNYGFEVHKVSSTAVHHRGKPFDAFLSSALKGYVISDIDGIPVTAICIDGMWFVVANLIEDENKFPDLGPFATPELALTCIRLGRASTLLNSLDHQLSEHMSQATKNAVGNKGWTKGGVTANTPCAASSPPASVMRLTRPRS